MRADEVGRRPVGVASDVVLVRIGDAARIGLDGAEAADNLEFRDFQTGRSYKVVLTQSAATDGGASYSIAITVTEKDGTSHSFTAGSPSYARKGVRAYHIKQIILAPDGASLVFVVQREEKDMHGSNVRYMVETTRP